MKKLILSALLLAGMTFVACSSDDNKGGNNCVTCTSEGETGQLCKGPNGEALVNGEVEEGITYEEALAFCENLPSNPGNGDDDDNNEPTNPGEPSGECKTCTVQGQSVEICKGENGNAFVEGTDMEIPYSTAIQALPCN